MEDRKKEDQKEQQSENAGPLMSEGQKVENGGPENGGPQ